MTFASEQKEANAVLLSISHPSECWCKYDGCSVDDMKRRPLPKPEILHIQTLQLPGCRRPAASSLKMWLLLNGQLVFFFPIFFYFFLERDTSGLG